MTSVIIIILVTGIVGGFAGHLAVVFPEPNPAKPLTKQLSQAAESSLVSMLIGAVAAFCVPAVISITATPNLMSRLTGVNPPAQADLLYLAGYCLIAAYSSRTFLQSMLNQVIIKKLQARQFEAESRIDMLEHKPGPPPAPPADAAKALL